MDTLDGLITGQLLDRLLAPDRLELMLTALAGHRAEKSAALDARVIALETRAAETDERLKRLYNMVEGGIAELDDLLKDRITELKADRDLAWAAVARARGANRPPTVIEPSRIREVWPAYAGTPHNWRHLIPQGLPRRHHRSGRDR